MLLADVSRQSNTSSLIGPKASHENEQGNEEFGASTQVRLRLTGLLKVEVAACGFPASGYPHSFLLYLTSVVSLPPATPAAPMSERGLSTS